MKHLLISFFFLAQIGILFPIFIPPAASAQNARDCIGDCSVQLSDCIRTAEADLERCARQCKFWNAEKCLQNCHDRHLEDIDACLNRFDTCISRCEI